jgi:tellurite resistance protein TerC
MLELMRNPKRRENEKIDMEENIAVRLLEKFVLLTPQLHENRFLVRLANGALYATPMLVALVIVEITNLVFAIDSIPAVLTITTDPFIVITSNVFAILGLRSLYFLLAGMTERFHYLKPALVALLLFIGTKMLASEVYKMPVEVSLVVIFAILGTALGLSAVKAKGENNIHATFSQAEFHFRRIEKMRSAEFELTTSATLSKSLY